MIGEEEDAITQIIQPITKNTEQLASDVSFGSGILLFHISATIGNRTTVAIIGRLTNACGSSNSEVIYGTKVTPSVPVRKPSAILKAKIGAKTSVMDNAKFDLILSAASRTDGKRF
jgi:hypothetical protein